MQIRATLDIITINKFIDKQGSISVQFETNADKFFEVLGKLIYGVEVMGFDISTSELFEKIKKELNLEGFKTGEKYIYQNREVDGSISVNMQISVGGQCEN